MDPAARRSRVPARKTNVPPTPQEIDADREKHLGSYADHTNYEANF
jgi:hypothetical protein